MKHKAKVGLIAIMAVLLGTIAIGCIGSDDSIKNTVVPKETPGTKEIKVDYYYLETCSLCKRIEPDLERMKQEYPLVITKREVVNPSEAFDKWKELDLKSVPCLVMENGEKYYSKDVTQGRFEERLKEIVKEDK